MGGTFGASPGGVDLLPMPSSAACALAFSEPLSLLPAVSQCPHPDPSPASSFSIFPQAVPHSRRSHVLTPLTVIPVTSYLRGLPVTYPLTRLCPLSCPWLPPRPVTSPLVRPTERRTRSALPAPSNCCPRGQTLPPDVALGDDVIAHRPGTPLKGRGPAGRLQARGRSSPGVRGRPGAQRKARSRDHTGWAAGLRAARGGRRSRGPRGERRRGR